MDERQQAFLMSARNHPSYAGWSDNEILGNINQVLGSGDFNRISRLSGALSKLPEFAGWKTDEVHSNLIDVFKPRQPAQQPQTKPPIGQRVEDILAYPRKTFQEGIQQSVAGNPYAGAGNIATGILAAPFAPIGLAAEGYRELPVVGEPFYQALSTIASIPTVIPKATEGILNMFGYTPEVERGLLGQSPEQYQQTQEASGKLADLSSQIGFAGPMAKVGLQPLKTAGSVFQKVLPSPEGVYAKGGGLGSLAPLERRAAARGVKERIELGGSYKQVPERFQKLQGQKTEIFERQINPEISKMKDAGLSRQTFDIADKAVADLYKRFPELKAPDAARFKAELENLKAQFIENNPPTLNPEQMQQMKTAVHQRAPMDEMSGLRNEFNKAIAYEERKTLEQWNPRLRPLHQRWAELNRLSESMREYAKKQGSSTSSPLSSAPFYMAVGDPVRGAILAEARNIARSPKIRSKAAFIFDRLQRLGNPREVEFLPPPFEPDPLQMGIQPKGFLPPGPTITPAPADVSGMRQQPFIPYATSSRGRLLPPPKQVPPSPTTISPELRGPLPENLAQMPENWPPQYESQFSTYGSEKFIPIGFKQELMKRLGLKGGVNSISDVQLVELAKRAGLYENAPIEEAPTSRGGSMGVRGKANQEQIRRFK